MADENLFYVGVKNPVELRRNVLEASKDVLELMRRYEHIMELKERRLQRMNQLKDISRDITKLCSRLKLALPSVDSVAKESEKHIRLTGKQMRPEQKEVMKLREKDTFAQSKTVSEVKKLERELMDIESKLKKISKSNL